MQQPQQSSMVAAAPAPPPGGGVLAQLQYRVDALEMRGRHMAAAVDDVSSPRGGVAHRLRDELYNDLKAELGKKLPSLDQVHSLQATLSAHVQRLPAVANYPHGRWTWNRGKLRASGGRSNPPLIPWSSEKLNTAPNALGWIADRAYIEVNASGMYAVLCAAFVPGARRHWRRRQRPGRAAASRDGTAAGCRLERPDRRLELARCRLARARLEGRNPMRGLADRGRLAAARRARLPGAQKVMVDAMEIEERWM